MCHHSPQIIISIVEFLFPLLPPTKNTKTNKIFVFLEYFKAHTRHHILYL